MDEERAMNMKQETYKKIVKAAGIEQGDLVLVQYWMGDKFSEDVAFLQAEIAAAGATPVMVVQNIAISQLINENATEHTYGDKFFKLYEDADVVIDLLERPVGVLSKPLAPEKMQILNSEEYAQVAESTEFTELKTVEKHFDMSVDEVRKAADDLLLAFAKSNKLDFSKQPEKKTVGLKKFSDTKNKRPSRYGSLFKK